MQIMESKVLVDTAEALTCYLRELYTFKGMAEAEIEEMERQLNDIVHRMERPDCTYRERSRLATKMANIRRERRKLKDWLKVHQAYFQYIGSDDGKRIQNMLGNFIGIGRRVEEVKSRQTSAG